MNPLISYSLQNQQREAVRQVVTAFTEVWPGSEFGPAHIALGDYNLLDDNLIFCTNLIESLLYGSASEQDKDTHKGHSALELASTLKFLDALRMIPEGWRDIHAEAIDDEGGEL